MGFTRARNEILNSVSIRTIVSYYCPAYPINRQGRMACPIHLGDGQNLQIYEDTNSFYCFTCKTAGDSIGFVSHLQGIGYVESAKRIDKDFGLDVFTQQDKVSADDYKRIKAKQVIRQAYFDRVSRIDKWYHNRVEELTTEIDRKTDTMSACLGIESLFFENRDDNFLDFVGEFWQVKDYMDTEICLLQGELSECDKVYKEQKKIALQGLKQALDKAERSKK